MIRGADSCEYKDEDVNHAGPECQEAGKAQVDAHATTSFE
jgi:hypothetical protein